MRGRALSIVCWLALAAPAVHGQVADLAPPFLHDVQGVHDIQAAFNDDSDKIRLVLLLSPT